MSADFIVRFSDFSGGDYGLNDPGLADRNQFRGLNLQVYDSGLLGPRPGLKPFPVTGLPTHPIEPGPVGFDVWGDNLIVVAGNPYRIPISTGIAVEMPGYNTPATSFVRFAQGDTLYSTSDGDVYRHPIGTDTTEQVTLPVGVKLSGIVRWGYYLVGVEVDNPNRIRYTVVNESGPQWSTWDVNGYLDVPDVNPITSLKPSYNALWIGSTAGWWSLSGVLAVRPTLRQVAIGNGPKDGRSATITTDNRVVYWGVEPTPIWFNGNSTWLANHFRVEGFTTNFPTDTVLATSTGKRIMMLGQPTAEEGVDGSVSRMVQRDEGMWTTHEFSQLLSGITPQDPRYGYELPDWVVFGVKAPTTIGDPIEIFSYQHLLERPAHADDQWAAPGDFEGTSLVDGEFDTAAFYEPQGRIVMVRDVIIHFRKWASGVEDSLNELHVKIRPLSIIGGGTAQTNETHDEVWTEPSNRSSTLGTDDSITVGFGDQGWSRGFQINLHRLRGVAIREINVACEVRERST